jgi:hypothetical protein
MTRQTYSPKTTHPETVKSLVGELAGQIYSKKQLPSHYKGGQELLATCVADSQEEDAKN